MQLHILYNYFDLEVYVENSSDISIKIFGKRNDRISCKSIIFENGFLKEINDEFSNNPLDDLDQLSFNQIVENNVSEIIKDWIDIFVYKKQKQPERIMNRLSRE
jgi:hypothetical protein